MGAEFVGDGVAIRDAHTKTRWMVVNADGSINVNTAPATTALTLGTNGVVSVNNAETTVLAANASRKAALVTNLGSSNLQLHFTAGQAFGAGPVLLYPGGSWQAFQGPGVYQGIVYGIRAAATENAGRVEET